MFACFTYMGITNITYNYHLMYEKEYEYVRREIFGNGD